MDKITDRAADFAIEAHGEQKRKYTGEPYFEHLHEVAGILTDAGMPDEVVAAGYLHDTLEDTDTTREQLEAEFGEDIAHLVWQVTDVSKPEDGNRARRKELDRDHLSNSTRHGAAIKLADLISNARDIVAHDPAFAKVYLAEKEKTLVVLQHGPEPLFTQAVDTLNQSLRRLALMEAAML